MSTVDTAYDLGRKVQELERELAEARQQQAGTSDILRIISGSSFDIARIFDAIAHSAARLCEAFDVIVLRVDGDFLRLVGHYGPMPAGDVALHRGTLGGRTVIERRLIHIEDLQNEIDEFPEGSALARERGHRTTLSVPLLKDGAAIGNIVVRRNEVRLFSDQQISLLKTFADQAVIAIENTRLFEAEQASKRELTDALEQQTATADVLKLISRSTFDLQTVFETLVESAARICQADSGFIFRLQDDLCRMVASFGITAEYREFQARNPIAPDRGTLVGRTVLERGPVHIEDAAIDSEYARGEAIQLGHQRTMLGVPLVREDALVGAITLARSRVEPFTEHQIELVTTFADQAVIAIENARLFEEVQARTAALTEALEQQTATADALKVISRSAFDLQRVLDALVESAARLCGAYDAAIFQVFGEGLRLVSHHGQIPFGGPVGQFTIRIVGGFITGRAVLVRRTIHVADILAEADEYPESWKTALQHGYRTALGVPLVHAGEAIGAIFIRRGEVRPFTERQIELVNTFADQAVIAIENTRLFEEVQARNRDLTALGEVGRAVSSTLDLKVVLKTIVERAVELSGTDAGSIFYYRAEKRRFELGETAGLNDETIARFRKLDIAAGQTGMGEAIAKREPLPIPDVVQRPSNALRDAALEAGLHAALIVPLLGSEGALGALVLQRRRTGGFPSTVISLMQSFADQSAIALENARLFEEIAQKSRELEVASQHKSQFVANMSHELRTPLAAILGYAELMQEGFYGNQSEKSMDALTRIRSNGKHLLGLINTVLDIAKIESGQFTLNMAEYAIESVVETVRSATESLAQNKKLALKTEVAKSLPIGLGDEQRLTQVLLNLVGNAIKFTDRGEVRVTAKAINGHFNVSVADTGPGIPEHERARIFEQFHQVDSSLTKAKGGTGLGLAIAKQIVEMHGGRIWVESTLGKGSTFQMELPTRTSFRKRVP
jgi:signal transduction histidine kinase/putative methionine-R-sulfoxide reductase with GAF domain